MENALFKKLIEVRSAEAQPLQLTLLELTRCSARFINSYFLVVSGFIFHKIGAGVKNTKL